MRRFIAWCCVFATMVMAMGGRAAAQEVGQPPSQGVTLDAYRAIETWVRAWKVEGGEHIPACLAAMVTLRLDGEVVGRGVVIDDKNRAGVVAGAAKAALAEAEPRLKIPRDALYEETRREIAKRVTISVQVSGELVPIMPRDAAEAAGEVSPGLEGVAVRVGDRYGAMFPERMLTQSIEPGAALGTLVGKLADDPTLAVEPLGKLANERGIVYYRFPVTHLAQLEAGGVPEFLTRCGRLVARDELDEEGLRRWADELARALTSGISGPDDPRGPWDPIKGLSEPSALTSQQAMLNAVALTHYKTLTSVEASRVDVIRLQSSSLAVWVAGHHNGQPEAVTSALGVIWAKGGVPLFLIKSDGSGKGLSTWLDRSRDLVAKWESDPKNDEGLNAGVLGLLAYAAAVLERPNEPVKNHRSVFASIPAGQLSSAMPWLGWAAIRTQPSGELRVAVALRDMREQLWKHQIQPEDLREDQRDLAGGIVFSATRQPMPSWQMARPLAFVATMLGDPRLTEEKEVPAELSRLLLSLRFLRQLSAREAECFMYRNPERAKGGVRSSLWDQRMPPEATAMTLMAVCETLNSLEKIRERRAAPKEQEAPKENP